VIKLITAIILSFSLQAFAQTKKETVRSIRSIAVEVGIDPDFAVAVATVESGLNPKAVGSLGEVGLFQLRPEYHNVKKGNTSHNTRVALSYMMQLKSRYSGKYGSAWFVLYNYGPYNAPKRPTETKYYKKVMRELGKIKTKQYLASN
jgi:soluble lytic murein transglycosylase-like protein